MTYMYVIIFLRSLKCASMWEMKNQFVEQDSLTRNFPHI